ncbi:MAG: C-terminal target protein [Bacteroidetes bacterium]|jgi:hypothetical protein|nr:C-terminal target protein [Bacteroidota bacterium]
MKKIYFSLALFAFTLQVSKAQLSLTKAFNDFTVGDVNNNQQYDSTTAVPKTTGANQNWDFSSLTSNSFVESKTYTTVASTAYAASFPNATIAETMSGSNSSITYFKATATTLEFQGLAFPSNSIAINFTNTGIFVTWPVSMGYNANDAFGGSQVTGTLTNSLDGSINVQGSGTGTVVMPGGMTLSNCLQVIVSLTVNMSLGGSTQTMVSRQYTYYHSSNKFPVLSAEYQTTTTGTVVSKSNSFYVNTAIVAGLTQHEINNNLSVFPNPASDMINISLDNKSNENVSVSLTNLVGQTVKEQTLGNDNVIKTNVDVSGLSKGIYLMNVKIGNTSSVKKIAIE